MSGFRRFGGKNFSATNNITRSFISTSDQMNISNFSGQENTREQFKSHIDMEGNSILHTGTLFFQNGSSMSSAVGETGPTGPIFQNVDGGTATTIYGGSSIIDCGNVNGV